MTTEETAARPERTPIERGSITWVPLTLVVASLLLLAVVPLLVQRWITEAREEIAVAAEPARPLVAIVRGSLLFESAGARAFALTADPEFATAHRQSQSRRIEAETAVVPLARMLGESVSLPMASMLDEVESVDATLDSLYDSRLPREAYRERSDQTQRRLLSLIDRTAVLDSLLVEAADARRSRIARAEAVGIGVTVALVALALVAALLVAQLGRRYRMTAMRLEERRVDLERVTQSRARLIRGFSHDVKNPLGAADGFLALLEDGIYGPLSAPQSGSISRARRSIHRALDLIRYLLDLAKAESGQLELHPVAVSVGELAREVADDFRAQAVASQLELRCEVADPLPDIETDPERARQVLANLVSNAIKYTRTGSVCIRVGTKLVSGGRDRREWVAIDVQDTGIGMAPDQVKALFTEFTRFRPDAADGTGVGLAISQRMAAALGGRVTVASAAGRGSTFTFWLPLRPR